jgi:hypothetical protein
MRVVILLPWRSDNGWRDQLWEFCRKRWEENFPEWSIFLGTPDEGPFNRSQAINRAAAEAGEWDVALIIDGDTVSDPEAVRRAVAYAFATGGLGIAHDKRVMMSERATKQVIHGRLPESRWAQRGNSTVTYTDSVSCAVAVSRRTWRSVTGFDERFVGWGFEDTAFEVTVQALTGVPLRKEKSTCYHLWHPLSPEAHKDSPTYAVNRNLRDRYLVARGDTDRVLAVRGNLPDPGPRRYGSIPRIIWRTVPVETSPQVEAWWDELCSMHIGWDCRTVREPVNPSDFPVSGHLFDKCANGAQKAGLIRLELLASHGGVYIDSDVQGVRPLDALTHLPAFAGWEDERVVPDAILGAVPEHPAILECLRRAVALIEGGSGDAWETGPGVTTAVLPWRDDVLLLPPGSLYPVHYNEKNKLGTRNWQPWVFAEHKWHHSWDSKKVQAPQSIAAEPKEWNGLYICIPWRDGTDTRRRQAYRWCVRYWEYHGFKVITGAGQSRAEMCNDAAQQAIAAGAEVLIFADADTWASPDQVLVAAGRARAANILVHAFDVYSRVGAGETAQAIRLSVNTVNPNKLAARGKRTTEHVSGLSAVSFELWSRIGGFDERFDRWGFEDHAFHLACEVLGDSAPERSSGPAVHWHHRSDPTKNMDPATTHINLVQEYCQAAGRIPSYGRTGKLGKIGRISIDSTAPDPEGMREVLAKEGGPLSGKTAVQ